MKDYIVLDVYLAVAVDVTGEQVDINAPAVEISSEDHKILYVDLAVVVAVAAEEELKIKLLGELSAADRHGVGAGGEFRSSYRQLVGAVLKCGEAELSVLGGNSLAVYGQRRILNGKGLVDGVQRYGNSHIQIVESDEFETVPVGISLCCAAAPAGDRKVLYLSVGIAESYVAYLGDILRDSHGIHTAVAECVFAHLLESLAEL